MGTLTSDFAEGDTRAPSGSQRQVRHRAAPQGSPQQATLDPDSDELNVITLMLFLTFGAAFDL